MIYCDTEWGTNGILAAVTLADAVLFVIGAFEIEFKFIHYFARFFGQSVFFYQRQNGCLDWSQHGRKFQHHAAVAAFEFLFGVGGCHNRQESTVNADRCFNHIRCV